MDRLKKLSIFLLVFILTSCSFGRPEDVTELIETPKIEEPSIKGTWEVEKVINTTDEKKDKSLDLGEKLYVDSNLVAFKDDYAFPPKISSKYVNLESYLKSRSVDNDFFDKDNVEILSVSQGQLYSKEFVKLDEKNIFTIIDEFIVIFKKIDEDVSRDIIEKYAKRAAKERTVTKGGNEVEEDITVLIGVRERVDNESGNSNFYYYTYCVRLEPDKMARIEKSEHIFFPNKQEFWKLKCEINSKSKKYNNFKAYPIKIENEINSSENKSKYKFENENIDLKINYVDEDYISFDYNLASDKYKTIKYAMIKTDDVKSNSFITIDDYTGNEKSKQLYKNLIYDQISKSFSKVSEEDIVYDYTNFGLVRNFCIWQFQSSFSIEKDGTLEQKSFPIDLAIREDIIDQGNKDITIDQVKNVNNQAKEYFELANGQYVVMQTPDEILFYHITNGFIDINPKFSIPLSNPTQIVMFEQGLGTYAEKWEEKFNDYNVIIH